MILRHLFSQSPERQSALSLYDAIVAQARQPWFYTHLQVPDTPDGRFELVALHVFAVVDRMDGAGEASRAAAQVLLEEFFADMDRSLRELGVGDISVGKRVRRMAEMFYGRSNAYAQALAVDAADGSCAPLRDAVERNIYRGEGPQPAVAHMADYVAALHAHFARIDPHQLMRGRCSFPAVPAGANE